MYPTDIISPCPVGRNLINLWPRLAYAFSRFSEINCLTLSLAMLARYLNTQSIRANLCSSVGHYISYALWARNLINLILVRFTHSVYSVIYCLTLSLATLAHYLNTQSIRANLCSSVGGNISPCPAGQKSYKSYSMLSLRFFSVLRNQLPHAIARYARPLS